MDYYAALKIMKEYNRVQEWTLGIYSNDFDKGAKVMQ